MTLSLASCGRYSYRNRYNGWEASSFLRSKLGSSRGIALGISIRVCSPISASNDFSPDLFLDILVNVELAFIISPADMSDYGMSCDLINVPGDLFNQKTHRPAR